MATIIQALSSNKNLSSVYLVMHARNQWWFLLSMILGELLESCLYIISLSTSGLSSYFLLLIYFDWSNWNSWRSLSSFLQYFWQTFLFESDLWWYWNMLLNLCKFLTVWVLSSILWRIWVVWVRKWSKVGVGWWT